MAEYVVTDPASGREVTLTGDSPPTEQELEQIFATIPKQQSAAPEKPQVEAPGMVKGIANEMLQGATFGFSDEIQSVLSAVVKSPFVSDKTFSQLMVDARTSLRDEAGAFREANPKTAMAANIAGGLLTGGAGAAKAVGGQLVKQGLKAATVEGAKQGAKYGAVAGAGFADAPELLSSETAVGAATGATAGAALNALAPAAIKAAASAGKIIPAEMPRKLLESALKFRPSIGTENRTKLTQTALDEGILPTVKGLEKITNKLETLDARLNTIIDEATNRGALISKKTLFNQLKQLRSDVGGAKLDAASDLNIIDDVAKSLNEHLKAIAKDKLTPRELQTLKTDAYKRINFDLSQGQGNFAKNEAKKAIARSAKSEVEKLDPNVKPINERMGSLIKLREELESVVSRLDNRNLISLDTAAKIGAGAATGTGAGTAAGAAASVLGNPRIKARIALRLENLRRTAELSDSLAQRLPPYLVGPISVAIGRTQDDLREEINALED